MQGFRRDFVPAKNLTSIRNPPIKAHFAPYCCPNTTPQDMTCAAHRDAPEKGGRSGWLRPLVRLRSQEERREAEPGKGGDPVPPSLSISSCRPARRAR